MIIDLYIDINREPIMGNSFSLHLCRHRLIAQSHRPLSMVETLKNRTTKKGSRNKTFQRRGTCYFCHTAQITLIWFLSSMKGTFAVGIRFVAINSLH